MIKAVLITLKKVTGLTSSLGEARFTGPQKWGEANEQLRVWRYAMLGGIDEVDFTVCYLDGSKYEGTIELRASAVCTEHLGKHIKVHCETYGGRSKPHGMSDAQYKEMLRVYAPNPEENTRWLDNYEIGD